MSIEVTKKEEKKAEYLKLIYKWCAVMEELKIKIVYMIMLHEIHQRKQHWYLLSGWTECRHMNFFKAL